MILVLNVALVLLAGAREIRVLEPGVSIERHLAADDLHSYRMTLSARQYVRLVVEQLDEDNVDVVVRVMGPDGRQIAEVNNNLDETDRPERVPLVAAAAGEYQVQVRPANKLAAAGRYRIRIEELREAAPEDQDRIAAERAYAAARLLRIEGSAVSLGKAIAELDRGIALWRVLGDRRREADAHNTLGQIRVSRGDYREALDSFTRALVLRREIRNRRGEATALHNIGATYWTMGEAERALEYYAQALPIRGEVGDHGGEAWTLHNMASAYHSLGKPRVALEYYDRALPLRYAARDHAGEAETLHNIGAVYRTFGEHRKALDHYDRARRLYRAIENRQGEVFCLQGIGYVHEASGEYQKALDSYQQTLAGARATGSRRWQTSALHSIGWIYHSFDEHQKALDSFSEALRLAEAMGDRVWEATTVTSIGEASRARGDAHKALEYQTRGLELHRALHDAKGEARALRSLGLTYLGMGRPQMALDLYRQGLATARAAGHRGEEAALLYGIGETYASLQQSQQALDHYDQALQIQRAIGDRSGEASTLAGTARVERDRRALVTARTQIEAALGIIESVHAGIDRPDLRTSYLASQQRYYEVYVDVLMRLHRRQPTGEFARAALEANERARARTLLETLRETRADVRAGVDGVLLQRERRLRQQLNATAERLTRLLSGKHTEEQAETVRRELDSLLADAQQVQGEIRAKSPQYAALTQPVPLTVSEIQQQVLDDESILLEYALGEERSYLWTVTRHSMTVYELPRRAEIEAKARRVYELLINSFKPEIAPQAKLEAAALSRMLLGPASRHLESHRLLIVADGALQYVPLGALPAPDAASYVPLIVNHEVVSLPSASVVAVLRRELAGRPPAAHAVAVLADPVLDAGDPRVARGPVHATGGTAAESELLRSAAESGGISFKRLPFSRQEAEAITGLAAKAMTLKALDFDASRTTAMSPALGQYRVVHFATHGLINSQHPELSGVVLSLVGPRGDAQDGFLRLHDIYSLKLGADLVVLSACRTALGKSVKGEGLIGLTRGFMYAGAPRILASLWDVRDRATAELMKRFYRGLLRDGLRPAAALRAAQVSMWKEPRWQAPYFWAGFLLQGDWN